MTNSDWKLVHSVALAALIVAVGLVVMWSADNGRLLFAWLFTLAALAVFTFVCGQGVTGRWMGALIDSRNVMSLARFQMIGWTILVLSAYLTAALSNIYAREASPLSISLPKELWLLMGISTVSLVGSPLILSTKTSKAPNAAEVERTFGRLAQQGDTPETLIAKGLLVANKDVSMARISDIFTGEEVGNAAHLDLARLQMFFFTLVTLFTYAVMLGRMFMNYAGGMIGELQPLDESMVALIAISNGGYLTSKAVPHSQQASAEPTAAPQAAPADDHPAMG
jgi:hypothetical protein